MGLSLCQQGYVLICSFGHYIHLNIHDPPYSQDYSVDVSLRQRWAEARLNNTLRRPIDTHDPMVVKLLWKPEVYFPNAKHGDFQYVTVPNVLVRIQPNGTILYILRFVVCQI